MNYHIRLLLFFAVLVQLLCYCTADYEELATDDPDVHRNISELIRSKGYICEEHIVKTLDGFLLGVQRIPCPRNKQCNPLVGRPVVFLQHGLLDSAATWVMNFANQSLGFVLADAGFDVWLGNIRGNTYSRRHLSLQPTSKDFWAWSWDEMAKYDLSAMVDHALHTSNKSQLFYIGHSQGTLIAFARLSADQNFSKKIKAFFALGPVTTVGHIKGAMYELSKLSKELEILFDLFGQHEFLPSGEVMTYLASSTCNHWFSRYVCKNILFLMTGFDGKQFNMTRLPVYLSHTPAGTSVQNVMHFAQMVKSGKFQMYDFGNEKLNMLHYNQTWPPLYNVSAVTVPVYMYSGDKDYLSDPQDVDELILKLRSLKEHTRINTWQHLDFVWGLSARVVLYDRIINIMKSML